MNLRRGEAAKSRVGRIVRQVEDLCADLKARTNTGNKSLQKIVHVGNLSRIRLLLDKGVHLERNPRNSKYCGQNSRATCRKASRSPRCVRTATLGHTLAKHLWTRQCRRMLSIEFRRKPSFLLEGSKVRNRSCRMWCGMAGAVSAFICHATLEGSI